MYALRRAALRFGGESNSHGHTTATTVKSYYKADSVAEAKERNWDLKAVDLSELALNLQRARAGGPEALEEAFRQMGKRARARREADGK
jgi:hypothetical protein